MEEEDENEGSSKEERSNGRRRATPRALLVESAFAVDARSTDTGTPRILSTIVVVVVVVVVVLRDVDGSSFDVRRLDDET